MIKKCPMCRPHEYQDKKYGDRMRVQNATKDDTTIRCSVCGSTNKK